MLAWLLFPLDLVLDVAELISRFFVHRQRDPGDQHARPRHLPRHDA